MLKKFQKSGRVLPSKNTLYIRGENIFEILSKKWHLKTPYIVKGKIKNIFRFLVKILSLKTLVMVLCKE